MFRDIIKMAPDSMPDPLSDAQRPDPMVNEIMQQRLRQWDMNVNDASYKKPFSVGHTMAVTAYHHTPIDVQAEIGLYTFLAVTIDNGIVDVPSLRQFVPRFSSGSPQLHPVLDRFVEICQGVASLFADFGGNIIRFRK